LGHAPVSATCGRTQSQGVDALRACVRHCGERGVRVLTVFAFSSENWNRPPEEVSG
jgi:undecaprenyl diphosphate synthase